MAMWGAPKAQLDHAQLACLAANEMLTCREEINQVWMQRIGATTDVRIGIASGGASVGNTGSRRKFKYGPLGETVNLASQLQGAGKQFDVHTLVNGETAHSSQAADGLLFRPLGRVRLVNMIRSVRVFESMFPFHPSTATLCRQFEAIVGHIESGNCAAARELILATHAEFPDDGPTRLLVERLQREEEFSADCLWALEHK